MKVEFSVKESPKLTEPIVICGLPGSAFVGKLAVDHLISELPAKLLADVYCDGLAPQVIIKDDGTVSMMKNQLFFWKASDVKSRDLIFYTGDSQPNTPEAEYGLSEEIIGFLLKEQTSRELITLGAFVTGRFSERPRVYAAATDEELVKKMEKFGCLLMNEGAITGMNGLLLGMAKIKGMSGYTLLGETSGYVFDPKASDAVLNSLFKIVGFSVNTKKLQDRAKEAEAVLQSIEKVRKQQAGGQMEEGPQTEKRRLDYIS